MTHTGRQFKRLSSPDLLVWEDSRPPRGQQGYTVWLTVHGHFVDGSFHTIDDAIQFVASGAWVEIRMSHHLPEGF